MKKQKIICCQYKGLPSANKKFINRIAKRKLVCYNYPTKFLTGESYGLI